MAGLTPIRNGALSSPTINNQHLSNQTRLGGLHTQNMEVKIATENSIKAISSFFGRLSARINGWSKNLLQWTGYAPSAISEKSRENILSKDLERFEQEYYKILEKPWGPKTQKELLALIKQRTSSSLLTDEEKRTTWNWIHQTLKDNLTEDEMSSIEKHLEVDFPASSNSKTNAERFENDFYKILKNTWDSKTQNELTDLIKQYTNQLAASEKREIEEWIRKTLKEYLSETEWKGFEPKLQSDQKRNVEQQTQIARFSKIHSFLPGNSNLKNLRICVSGNDGILAFAYSNNTLGVLRYKLINSTIQSTADLTALFASVTNALFHELACGDNIYHLIITDNNGTIIHGVIEDLNLKFLYEAVTGVSPINAAPKPAKLPGNQAIIPLRLGRNFYISRTNSSGQFVGLGMIISFDTSREEQLVSFENGDYHEFQSKQGYGFFNIPFNITDQTTDYLREINNGTEIFPIKLPNTPLPAVTNFILMLTTGADRKSPTRVSYDRTTRQLWQKNLGSEPNSEPSMDLTHCGKNTYTVRDTQNSTTGSWTLFIDALDLENNISLIDGEKPLDYSESLQPNSQISCFSDLTGLIAFLDENQNAVYKLMQLANPAVEIPVTGTILPPPLSLQPITNFLNVSSNAITFSLIDAAGTEIVFTGNLSQVPLDFDLPIEVLKNISYARGNATEDATPSIKLCGEAFLCSNVTKLDSQLDKLVNLQGVDWKIIVPVVVGVAAAAFGGGLIFYFAYYKKHHKTPNAKEMPLPDVVVNPDTAPQRRDTQPEENYLQIASAYQDGSY